MNQSRRDFVRSGLVLGAGSAILGLDGIVNAAKADSVRYVEAHLKPAAFGFGGETPDLTQFQVNYYKTNDSNMFLQRVFNAEQPDNYLEMRKLVTVTEGETEVVDFLVALPNEGVGGEDLGGLTAPAEIPGTTPGISNTVELGSSIGNGSPYLVFNNTGRKTFAFDEDSDYYSGMLEVVQNSVGKWKDMPTGYNIGDLANSTTYRSSQGEPAEWNPGDAKFWRVKGVDTLSWNGLIDFPTSTIYINKRAPLQATSDEEITSGMIIDPASPYPNQAIPVVPDAYKKFVGLMGFTSINDESGNPLIYVPFGSLDNVGTVRPSIHGANAGLNEGIGEGVVIGELAQTDRFNSEGYVISSLNEPVVSTEKTTMGGFKALWR